MTNVVLEGCEGICPVVDATDATKTGSIETQRKPADPAEEIKACR